MPEDKIKPAIIGVLVVGGIGTLIYLLTRKKEAKLPISEPSVQPMAKPTIKEETTEGKLKQIAMKELNLGEEELTIRNLRPEDLGVTGAWSFNIGSANAWNNIISANLGDNRFLMLTGVTYTGSAITQIRMVLGGSVKEIWTIQHIPAMETPRYVDLTPTVIKQNQSISIDVWATAVGTESLIFEGIVVEKKGLVIA